LLELALQRVRQLDLRIERKQTKEAKMAHL
jgi:hypothetical protein